jgi:hypothetical protein
MSRIRWVSFFLIACVFSTTVAWGQNQTRSIAVTGRAEREVAPDRYQISVAVKANGKTMTIASDDYRKKIENVRTVFNEMDFPEVKIVPKGKVISDSHFVDPNEMQIMMMEGQDPNQQEKNFYIVERLILEWQPSTQASSLDIENGIHGLLDRIKTEKVSFAGEANPNYYQVTSLVCGVHSQLRQEEKMLRAAAFADAKAQAEELAALSGDKVGRVIEIRVESPGESDSSFDSHSPSPFSALGSDDLRCQLGQKIKLKSILQVRFELE